MVAATNDMASSWDEVEVVGIDPNEQGSEGAELKVIHNGERVASLSMGATDAAFEFFEACFDFPASTVEFDNFLDG